MTDPWDERYIYLQYMNVWFLYIFLGSNVGKKYHPQSWESLRGQPWEDRGVRTFSTTHFVLDQTPTFLRQTWGNLDAETRGPGGYPRVAWNEAL